MGEVFHVSACKASVHKTKSLPLNLKPTQLKKTQAIFDTIFSHGVFSFTKMCFVNVFRGSNLDKFTV